MQNSTITNIPSVTMLRGIASFGVCFAHFTGTVQSEMLKKIGGLGVYGVPVFFMISGFIIPYALFNSGYKINNYFRFVLKRVARLDPPYILTILGIFLLSVLAQLSPHHTAPVIELFNRNTFYHLFYLVEILNGKWLIAVFWTLAIEFQFYLFIGLLFPLLISKKTGIQLFAFLTLCALPFLLKDDRFVSNYLLAFLPGILFFCFRTKQISANVFIFLGIISLVLGFIKTGVPGVICPLISVCFIQFVTKPIKPLIFLGTISYSLYLIHTPVGTDAIINYLQNFIVSENGRIWLMFLALPVTIGFAWIFYLIAEKPSINMARKINYSKKDQDELS